MKAGAPLLVAVIALGAVVRWAGGAPLFQTELLMSPEGPGATTAAGGVEQSGGSPEQAAAAFYAFLQRGDYGKAWEVSLEPDWEGPAAYVAQVVPSPRVFGWTTEMDFVRRCADDIGSSPVKLNAVQVTLLPAPPDTPEGRAAAALGAPRLFGVRAAGHMLGACMIYHWERDLVVAEVAGSYRVVLPGTKAARALFHQEWFSHLSLVGSLRGSAKVKSRYLKPWIFGAAAGAIFVLADAAFAIAPPSAYAFCLSCHVRDLVNTALNALIHSRFQVTEVAGRALMLTSPGVLIGAFIAARLHGEVKPRKADRPILLATLGFLVMTIGILIFGCPTRIVLRAGYGEIYGIVALLGLGAGITAATLLMKLRFRSGK